MTPPLDHARPEHRPLLAALFAAHALAARRESASTVALINNLTASGSYPAAITSAILTIGGMHAPLALCAEILTAPDPSAHVAEILADGGIVPGWGSSFTQEPEEWTAVHTALHALRPDLTATIEAITAKLTDAGKPLLPNAAIYTAACALTLQIPAPIAAWLFIQSRLPVWTEIARHHLCEPAPTVP